MAGKIFGFQKEERLCSKKLLEQLFTNGSSFLVYPFRVTWLLYPNIAQKFPAQLVVAVPKKRFKHAVDRNLIKRRIKEAYRLNKDLLFYSLLREKDLQVILSVSYVGKEAHEFEFMEKKLKSVFLEFSKQISK